MIDELKRLIKEELLDLSSSQSNVSHPGLLFTSGSSIKVICYHDN